MDVNTINVFSINNQGGNPCAIVDNTNNLSVEKMQIMATHLNFPETVYIIRDKNRYIIRFFATKGELPLCCYGALGAAFYLFKSNSPKPINIQSYHDRHKINVRYANNLVSMSIPIMENINNKYRFFTHKQTIAYRPSLSRYKFTLRDLIDRKPKIINSYY